MLTLTHELKAVWKVIRVVTNTVYRVDWKGLVCVTGTDVRSL